MQEKIRTIHVYLEEEEPLIVDAEPEQPPQHTSPLTRLCFCLVAVLCLGLPALATIAGQAYPDTYDATRSQTLTLTLSLHPTKGQLPLYALPIITVKNQATVAATGSVHQDATHATGLITFYNGLFTSQTILAGTTFRGKSGVAIVTSQTASIPAATPTTPPTYGTVSVTAVSSVPGASGNIAARDIDQACCAPSVLVQNLYAFSGGQDAQERAVLTDTDLATGTRQLTAQVETATTSQAQREAKPGEVLLPLHCSHGLSASHQAGEQADSSTLILSETCTPLAYFAPDILDLARQQIPIPQGYHLVSFSAFVGGSRITATGGTLTVAAIAYLKRDMPYHFAGK